MSFIKKIVKQTKEELAKKKAQVITVIKQAKKDSE